MSENRSHRINYNQLTLEERQQYWENYKKLGQPNPLTPKQDTKFDDGEIISEK